MGTDKRDRQKANRQAKLEAQQAAEAKAKRNRSLRNFAVLAVVVVLVLVVISLTGCSSDSDGAKVDPATQDGDAYAAEDGTSGPADGTEPVTPAASAAYGTGACPPEDGAAEPVLDFDAAFEQCISEDTTYLATIETTEGTVVAELDPSAGAPITVNNFVSLARNGYFDGNVVFRTEAATGILQTGSPHTQANTDPGPGYEIPDEGVPWTAADYGPGTLAMANSGPNTGGGQFFFLANEGGSYLGDPAAIGDSAGAYTVFGKVTEGLDVLVAISQLESSPGSGVPAGEPKITSVTITEA